MQISVRELEERNIALVVDYFINASSEYLLRMGADPTKLPSRVKWIESIKNELSKTNIEKGNYYTIWQIDGKTVGHSNINKIKFGKEAYMHLHMWYDEDRRKGTGRILVDKSISYYFIKFKLKELICEPYALNAAPIKVLKESGFDFEKEHKTIPGVICFPQNVKRFLLTREKWMRNTQSFYIK